MGNTKYKVLDLFSGCGGLSCGLEKAGFIINYGIDNWADALKTFEHNHNNSKTINADLSKVKAEEIIKQYKISDIDLVAGGPPCQGFSIAGKRDINDERNHLYKSFVDFVKILKPKAFLMENVPNILSMGKGIVKENILDDFRNLGYTTTYTTLLASDFGVPQNRKRAFFVGVRNNIEFDFPKAHITERINTKDAISDLPEFSISDGDDYPNKSESNYQKQMRNGTKVLFNHQITKHEQKTIEIISMVPDGGNYKDLPIELQQTRKVNIAWTRFNSKKPSYTIDTGHRHHFHYKYNRVPTVRESARLQSFSDKFIFLGSKTSQYKQVGNAVPPILAKVIGEELIKYLENV